MPIYTFRCAECEAEVDELLPIEQRDDPTASPICTRCKGGSYMLRVHQAAGFVLKGEGWAKDGYSRAPRGE